MQNEQTLQQMIREYEANMPPEIMDLIKSFDWKKEVRVVVNQNQLMIDVGSDLEESIYLMLLGAVKVADLYERLVEVHQIPEDKARKVIEEIENQIFIPLHKKLMELDAKDSSVVKNDSASSTPRDTILAEIEKEPEPLIKLNFAPKSEVITPNQSQNAPTPTTSLTDTGIVKPFALSNEKAIEESKEQITAPVSNPVITPVQGLQENPIAAGLTKPTVTEAPSVTKSQVTDPYREPIE